MNPHQYEIEKLYAHLHSSVQGLPQTEAALDNGISREIII
jgi:hypothetical protein